MRRSHSSSSSASATCSASSSLGGFKLGAVTGTLLAGVLVGQLGITLPNEVKQCFFLLFLFAIGFRTGPQFFRGLRSDGLAHAALAAIVATAGCVVAYVVSRLFGYDAGTAAGLVAGCAHRIRDDRHRDGRDLAARCSRSRREPRMANNIPVAFAVTYLVGVTGAAWVLSQLGPKLMRVDLAEECRKLEEQMHEATIAPGDRAARIRAARLRRRRRLAVGRTNGRRARVVPRTASASSSSASAAAARFKRPSTRAASLHPGDVVAVSGRRTTLVEVLESPGSGLREVDDKELLDMPGDIVDVVVTNGAHRRPHARGARRGTSGARRVPAAHHAWRRTGRRCCPETIVNRGDVLTIVGSLANIARASRAHRCRRPRDRRHRHVRRRDRHRRGRADRPARRCTSDSVEIGLSLPVGVLLGGLVCGWLRSVKPSLVRSHSRGPRCGSSNRSGSPASSRSSGSMPAPTSCGVCRPADASSDRGGNADDHDLAADRRLDRALGVQDAPGRAARRVRRRVYGDAGAGGGAGVGEERRAVDRVRRRLRRRQRATRDLGHGHRASLLA